MLAIRTATRPVAAARPSRTAHLRVVAFAPDKRAMLQTAHKYVNAWQPDMATGDKKSLDGILQEVISSQGVLYRSDGVVHLEDRLKGPSQVAEHIKERYEAYKHVLHDCFAMAADEDSNSVFLGLRFIMQNTGHVAGRDATGRSSQGVLLERLEFDSQGKISAALVARPLTKEEADTMTIDPSQVKPAPLDDSLLYAPQEQLSEQERERMSETVQAWVHCWDAGADLTGLDQILSPEVRQVSGYGLGKRSTPFEGIDGAKEMIQGVQERMENINKVVSLAICEDRRAGFVLWEANNVPKAGGSHEVQQGLDYLRFDSQGRILLIFSYTMRPYSNVRTNAPRGDKVD